MEKSTEARDWHSLSQASEYLGIHPATLREWVDAGMIQAYRTPGGHRRFQLNELRAFLNGHRAGQKMLALAVTPDQTLTQIRENLDHKTMARQTWYQLLTDVQRAQQREMGQRLLGLLLQFVSRQENAEHFLEEGRALARVYGEELARAGFSVTEMVQAFLFFRQMILEATYHPKGGTAQGDEEGLRLLRRINMFMDELLIATLDGFQAAQVTSRARAEKSVRARKRGKR